MKKTLFVFVAAMSFFACQNKMKPTMPKKAAYDMYIGTYTHKESFVSGKGEGIYHIQLDSSLNEINRSVITGVENPSFVILSPDRKYLFCVEELNPNGFISSYNIENQEVKRLSRVSSHGGSPCHISLNSLVEVDNNGYLMSANYMGGNIALFQVKNGVLSEATDSLKFEGKGKTARQEASHPHQAGHYDREDWLVTDLGLDKVYHIQLGAKDKKLKNLGSKYEIGQGAGPRHVFQNYLLNELNSTINVYVNYAHLMPTKLQTISTLPSDYKGKNFTAEIRATDKFVYASNRGHNSIAMYKILADKTLESIGFEPTRGDFPRNFNITPDGKYLFCANQNSDNIVFFEVQNDGQLKFLKEIKVNTPVCIAFL